MAFAQSIKAKIAANSIIQPYLVITYKILFANDFLDPCEFPNDFHRTSYEFETILHPFLNTSNIIFDYSSEHASSYLNNNDPLRCVNYVEQ